MSGKKDYTVDSAPRLSGPEAEMMDFLKDDSDDVRPSKDDSHLAEDGKQENEFPALTIMPDVIRRVLDSPLRSELVALADHLDERSRKGSTITYHTEVGDVCCPTLGNTPVYGLEPMQLFMVTMTADGKGFAPRLGVPLKVTLGDMKVPLDVVCVSDHLRPYVGLNVDLLCFMTQSPAMEKNGRTRPDAPSSVSGKVSDHIDENDEPVAEGEKSASVKDFDVERPAPLPVGH